MEVLEGGLVCTEPDNEARRDSRFECSVVLFGDNMGESKDHGFRESIL